MNLLVMDPPSVGGRGASGPHGHRRICKLWVVLMAPLLFLGPVPVHAGEADVTVPMRRDIGATVPDRSDAVPDSVLAATELIRREIEVLREELGVDDFPARAESHGNRRPVHVFVKSLEVMSKVIAVQRRFGVPEASLREMPLVQLSSGDVLAAVQDILDGIRAIKTQMVIETEVDAPELSGPRTLTAAYRNLADSSAMLDGLVGRELTPEHVFQNVMAILDEMSLIAVKLQVRLNLDAPEVADARESVDVAQQALRAAYKVVSLQARLGMEASAVPTLTMVRVTPTEAYDLTGVLRAELTRIKWHLGVNVPGDEITEPARRRDSTDVFAQMLLVVGGLDTLAAGLDS